VTTQDVVQIITLIVAFAALVFSIVSFRRQQDRAEALARASVRPLLSIKSQTYVDLKSIRLLNYGLGPAVVKKAEFRRGPEGAPTNNIVKLFDIGSIHWESFVPLLSNRPIPAQGEIVLIKESLAHIEAQGHNREAALAMLARWQEQKRDIMVRIEFEDIYGNQMPVLEETLA
jgi:hypothetical protein